MALPTEWAEDARWAAEVRSVNWGSLLNSDWMAVGQAEIEAKQLALANDFDKAHELQEKVDKTMASDCVADAD